jgi:ArsR family transcriptional regulator, arsenate/arsenite/antimonite-responsive transcriptional repressor
MREPTVAVGRSFLSVPPPWRHHSTMVDSTSVDVSVLASHLPLLKALADPTRLRVIALLGAGPRCACELQGGIDVPANLLSHHLKVLREAGLIDGTRRGRWIDYRLRPGPLAAAERMLADLREGRAVASAPPRRDAAGEVAAAIAAGR